MIGKAAFLLGRLRTRERQYLAIDITWCPRRTIEEGNTEMIDDEETIQVEKLVGETILLQRVDSLIPIHSSNPIARFQIFPGLCSPSFLVVEEINGEQRGRTWMLARHLIVDVEPLGCAGDREWRVLLRAPYTVEEVPSGWSMLLGRASFVHTCLD